MEKHLIVIVVLLLMALGGVVWAARAADSGTGDPGIRNWLCYYGMTTSPTDLNRFDLIVLDGTYHPPLPDRVNGKPVVLGYVSVAEVVHGGYFWPRVKDQPFLKKRNPVWGSWIVDVTHPKWQRFLLDTVMPAVVHRGFDGFFLDNLDSGLGLPESAGTHAFDQKKAVLVDLIQRIRTQYPHKRIAVNRGLSMLDDIAGFIDYAVIEGLYSTYSFSAKQYRRVDSYAQNLLLQQVSQGLRANPALTVLTVDYAPPDRPDLVHGAIAFSKSRGFIPYVGTIKLDSVFFHALSP